MNRIYQGRVTQVQQRQANKAKIKIAGVVGPFGSGSPANHSTGFDLPCGI
jgi:hypothetical protein